MKIKFINIKYTLKKVLKIKYKRFYACAIYTPVYSLIQLRTVATREYTPG